MTRVNRIGLTIIIVSMFVQNYFLTSSRNSIIEAIALPLTVLGFGLGVHLFINKGSE